MWCCFPLLRAREWWGYAEPPFDGPAQDLSYPGRYSHRVAILQSPPARAEDGPVSLQRLFVEESDPADAIVMVLRE